MDERLSKSARSSGTEEELDRISTLPEQLTEQILLRLPLRDAVRTSVLSSKWRDKWTTLPRLVIHENLLSVLRVDPRKFTKAIDNILILHQGPIKAFELVCFCGPEVSDVHRWIRHLSRHSINELRIKVGHRLGVPDSLFACQDLTSLDLKDFSFRPSSSKFTGFKNLTDLALDPVVVTREKLEELILSCPQLNKLKLSLLPDITHIRIDAPNLQHLEVVGNLEAVQLTTSCLLALKLVFENHDDGGWIPEAKYNRPLKLSARLSEVKYLHLDGFFIKPLDAVPVPDMLPNSLLHLKHLFVCMNFSSMEEVSTTLCLLRSSPNLERVVFSASEKNEGSTYGVSSFLKKNSSPCLFKNLKKVWVLRISNNPAEKSFIKFMISSSPMLENMVIRPDCTEGGFKLLRKLVQLPIKVFYMNPSDKSRDPRYNLDHISYDKN